MKLKDILINSIKTIFRNKSSILIMILILVCSVSSLFSLSYKNSFEKYWDIYVQKSPEFRIFNVYYNSKLEENHDGLSREQILAIEKEETDEIIETLKKNEHILGASIQSAQTIDMPEFSSNDRLSSVYLQSVPINNMINIISGDNLDKYEDGENVMICPNIIKFPGIDGKFDSNNSFALDEYLNKEISVNYALSVPMKYKLVGLYDNFSTYSYGQVCYTSYKSLEESKNVYYKANPNTLEEWLEYKKEAFYTNVYFMIDNIKNLNSVDNFLREHNWRSDTIIEINTDTVEEITNITDKVTFILYILTIAVISFTLMQNILRRTKELLIYYATGYTNVDIIKIIFVENLYLIIIPFILSVIITQVMLTIYKHEVLIDNARLYLMNPIVDFGSAISTLSLTIIIPFAVTFITYIFSKKNMPKLEEE